MDKMMMGVRIQNQRLALGFTQEELAEKVNLSHRMIAEIERGKVGMSLETVMKITQALHMTPNDLLLPDASLTDDAADSAAVVVDALKTCTATQREAIIEIIKVYLRSV